MTPIFDIFYPIGFLFYAFSQSYWLPLCAGKISLSLSYLVSEILGPIVGLILHQNVLFNILCQFSPWFVIQLIPLTPYSLILDIFDPLFLQNLRSDLVQHLISCWTHLLKIWWSTLPPHRGHFSAPKCNIKYLHNMSTWFYALFSSYVIHPCKSHDWRSTAQI